MAFFLYLTIFLICSASSVCPFASSPSCSHEACHLAIRLFFSFVTFLVRFPLFRSPVSPHCVTHSEKKIGLGSPPVSPVSLPFSRGSNSIHLFPCQFPSHLGFRSCISAGDGYTNTLHVFLRLRVSKSQVSIVCYWRKKLP